MTTATWGNQGDRASALGVSDRRVRQLIEQYIVPRPHHVDGHDIPLAVERYQLYRDGSQRDWDDFFDEAEAGTTEASALMTGAFEEGATLEDVKRASIAVQDDPARLHFLSACKSRSKAESDLFHGIWSKDEKEKLSHLLSRNMTLMGADRIVDDDTGAVIAVMLVCPKVSTQASKPRKSTPARPPRRSKASERSD